MGLVWWPPALDLVVSLIRSGFCSGHCVVFRLMNFIKWYFAIFVQSDHQFGSRKWRSKSVIPPMCIYEINDSNKLVTIRVCRMARWDRCDTQATAPQRANRTEPGIRILVMIDAVVIAHTFTPATCWLLRFRHSTHFFSWIRPSAVDQRTILSFIHSSIQPVDFK